MRQDPAPRAVLPHQPARPGRTSGGPGRRAARRARRRRHRRGVVGRRRPGRGDPGLTLAGRGSPTGPRHVVPVEQLVHGGLATWRCSTSAWSGRPCANAACYPRLAPHLVRPVPFLYPLQHRGGSGCTPAPAWRSTTRWASVRQRPRAAPPPAPDPQGRAAAVAVAAQGRAGRRHPVLRRAGRRRAAHPAVVRTAAVLRRPGRQPGPRDRVLPRGRAGHRRPGPRLDPGTEMEVRARRVVIATGVLTDMTQAMRRERAVPGPRLQGRAPGRAAGPDPVGDRADPAHRDQRAVRHPVGPALDHRHHRHRLGARQGAPGGLPHRHRLPARARQPGARHAADP